MKTAATIRDHPIHPMLVAFPIAFWIGSLICDGAFYLGAHIQFWKDMAFYLMTAGVVGALAAAVPGFMDYLGLKDRQAKRIATIHMALNVIVIALFVFNLGVRLNANQQSGMLEVGLSVAGVCILGASGWLGGHLVYVGHVGVKEGSDTNQVPRRVA